MKITPDATCVHPVLDAEQRATLCGKPVIAYRVVEGELLPFCAAHTVEVEAKRNPNRRPGDPVRPTPEEREADEMLSRARWDAAQAKLPPGQRRTYEQSEEDDHAAFARGYRKMAAEDRALPSGAPKRTRRTSRKKGGAR
jgi:hypothetical protein